VLADTVKVIEGRDWSVETGEGGGRASMVGSLMDAGNR